MPDGENNEFKVSDDEKKLVERLRGSQVTPDQAVDLMTTGARAKQAAGKNSPPPTQDSSDPEALVTQKQLTQTAAQTREAVRAMDAQKTINSAIAEVVQEDGVYAGKPRKIASLQRDIAQALQVRPELASLDDAGFLEAVRAETKQFLKEEHEAHTAATGSKKEAEMKEAKANAAKTGERSGGGEPPPTKVAPASDAVSEGPIHVIKDEKSIRTGVSETTQWPSSDREVTQGGLETASKFLRDKDSQ